MTLAFETAQPASDKQHHPQVQQPVPRLSVSIVVPVHNGGAAFQRCVASLTALDPPPLEIIVVADGDTDGSRDVARAGGAHVVERARPGGPAQARNAGAWQARGDLLFFVDADVVVPPDVIDQIQNVFRSDPTLAALIGSYDDAPGDPAFLSQYRNLLHHYVHQTGQETAFTFWGACGVVRRDVFAHLGGFDERFRQPSIEDIELGYRLVKHGYRIRLVKTLQVKHLKRWTARRIIATDVWGRALPWTELILREKQIHNDLNLQRRSRWSVVCAYAALGSLLAGTVRPRAWWGTGLSLLLLVALNHGLYRFWAHKRGVWFALRAVPWHILYYLYSGLAFAVGSARVLGPRVCATVGLRGRGSLAPRRPSTGNTQLHHKERA